MNPFTEHLTAYIDGELDAETVTKLEAEMARDPALKALEQRLRSTMRAVEALPAPSLEASPALRRAVLNAVGEPTFRERWFRWPALAPLGLALAAAATFVVWPRAGDDVGGLGLDEEKLMLAQNLEVVEDLDLVGLESPDDLEVVAQLSDLEGTP